MHSLIVFCAKNLIYVIVLLVFMVWLKLSSKLKKEFAAAVALAGIIAFGLSKVAGGLYFDPRPFVTQHLQPLVSHGADNGFPSEHTVLAMTLTAVVYYYNKRVAVALFIMTVFVGVGRVLAHVHSPIDVLAALAFGLIAGVTGVWLARRWFATKKPNENT